MARLPLGPRADSVEVWSRPGLEHSFPAQRLRLALDVVRARAGRRGAGTRRGGSASGRLDRRSR